MTRFEEKLKIEAVHGAAAVGADSLTQHKQRHTRAQHSGHMKKIHVIGCLGRKQIW